jgi:hypothetical protein
MEIVETLERQTFERYHPPFIVLRRGKGEKEKRRKGEKGKRRKGVGGRKPQAPSLKPGRMGG